MLCFQDNTVDQIILFHFIEQMGLRAKIKEIIKYYLTKRTIQANCYK